MASRGALVAGLSALFCFAEASDRGCAAPPEGAPSAVEPLLESDAELEDAALPRVSLLQTHLALRGPAPQQPVAFEASSSRNRGDLELGSRSSAEMGLWWKGSPSDCQSEPFSSYIVDYGGPSKGIERLVVDLQMQPMPVGANSMGGSAHRYEVLECISGLLKRDVNLTRSRAVIKAGLLEQLARVMQEDSKQSATVEAACDVVASLVDITTLEPDDTDRIQELASYTKRLADLGVVKMIQGALVAFSDGGSTNSKLHPVIPGCSRALLYAAMTGM